MTPADFCQWLDGYLLDRERPDPEVIKAKAREIAPVAVDPFGPCRTPPYQPLPTAPAHPGSPWYNPPLTADPPWRTSEIFSGTGQAQADPGRDPLSVQWAVPAESLLRACVPKAIAAEWALRPMQ